MYKLKLKILLGLILLPLGAHAAQLVTGAEIVAIENTSGGTNEFVLHLRGGIGPCSNNFVRFYRARFDALNGGNGSEVLARAYSSALMAFSTGLKVDISTVDSSISCDNPVWIKVYK